MLESGGTSAPRRARDLGFLPFYLAVSSAITRNAPVRPLCLAHLPARVRQSRHFFRNQIYADCVDLSAIEFRQIAWAYLPANPRRLLQLVCVSRPNLLESVTLRDFDVRRSRRARSVPVFRACPGKVDPLFRQGHASQVFELARILFDQVIPPDRKAR
jgi:hypothetical protein